MKYYNFKKRNLLSGPHLLGVLLLPTGFFAIVSPYIFTIGVSSAKATWVGVFVMILGAGIISTFEGTLLDFRKRRFKEYTSSFGFKFGQWRVLPNISTVRLISQTRKVANTPNGISPTLSGTIEVSVIILVGEDSAPKFNFVITRKAHAHRNANIIAKCLDVELDSGLDV